MEQKIKQLEMLQNIISRMASNSFMLKRWIVTLVSALLVVAVDKNKCEYVVLLIFPIIIFWYLDSYYLSQERIFRCVYDRVRIMDEKDITFDMKPTNDELSAERNTVWSVFWSNTEGMFYGSMILIILIAIVFQNMDRIKQLLS